VSWLGVRLDGVPPVVGAKVCVSAAKSLKVTGGRVCACSLAMLQQYAGLIRQGERTDQPQGAEQGSGKNCGGCDGAVHNDGRRGDAIGCPPLSNHNAYR